MSNKFRVVIDTNLIISALIFGGNIAKLRFAWQNQLFIPLASETTINELIRVLTYPKFKLTVSEQEDLLSDYLLFCDTIIIPEKLPPIPECRDPFDKPFLLLAMVGNADYLVTGDQDLLCLADSFICPIITIQDFFRIIDY
jgi:uncharacterized protein